VNRADVVVVGAGLIGCSIARSLARGGMTTLVLDRDEPGSHASRAAAGMLTPLAEAPRADAFLHLLRESLRLFPALAAELHEETGVDVALRGEGTVFLALREQDCSELEERFRWQHAAGLPVQRLQASHARTLEPELSPRLRLALRFPDDHQVDNRLLAAAMPRAAAAAGAVLRRGEVRGVWREGTRLRGVELAGGERVEARWVVIAAGCWSGRLDGLPRPLPVRPVHGQLLALDAGRDLVSHVVDTPRVYLVPRAGGRVIVGTTVEETGYRLAVTEAAVARLRAAAAEAVPALAGAPLAESWSGLRPGTPDDLPILGPDPEVEGLVYATGHYRNGILLAPITAQRVAGWVAGEPYREEGFGVVRFHAA
jgi:glycine oxidase